MFASMYKKLRPLERLGARGFTMPELLVALGVLLVLGVSTFILLRPKSYIAESVHAERRLEIALIAQALERYKAAVGHMPTDLPDQPTLIGLGDEAYDLCSVLVPTFAKDIPLDPQIGIKYQSEVQQNEEGAPCSDPDVDYASGYTIAKAPGGGVRIAAPTTDKETLAITVR